MANVAIQKFCTVSMLLSRVRGPGAELTPDLPAPAPQAAGKCLQFESYAAKNEQFRLQASRCHSAVHLSN